MLEIYDSALSSVAKSAIVTGNWPFHSGRFLQSRQNETHGVADRCLDI